jgi:prepilin-type N-terminal cleavage/methylation domain-containing protein
MGMRKSREGFTVVELLITIALIGILAAVAIPQFLRFNEKQGGGVSSPGCGKAKSVEELLADLKSDNPSIKLQAIKRLLSKKHQAIKQPEVIDWLIAHTAGMLNNEAVWIDQNQARQFYETIKRYEDTLIIDSLIRHCLSSPKIRLRILFLGVKLGIPGSQERLNALLMDHGDKQMAEDFLNSGSDSLFAGGNLWAKKHGYSIFTGQGSHRTRWGQF